MKSFHIWRCFIVSISSSPFPNLSIIDSVVVVSVIPVMSTMSPVVNSSHPLVVPEVGSGSRPFLVKPSSIRFVHIDKVLMLVPFVCSSVHRSFNHMSSVVDVVPDRHLVHSALRITDGFSGFLHASWSLASWGSGFKIFRFTWPPYVAIAHHTWVRVRLPIWISWHLAHIRWHH